MVPVQNLPVLLEYHDHSLFLFGCVVYGVAVIVMISVFQSGRYGLSTCLMFQTAVLLPSLRSISQRLKNIVATNDLIFYNDSLVWCRRSFMLTFGFASLFSCIVVGLFATVTPMLILFAVGLWIGQLAYCCVLTANLLFILVDCKVSSVLLDELVSLHRHDLLTVDKFNQVREEIDRRANTSLWLNYSIVVVCIVNVVGALMFLFFSPLQSWLLAGMLCFLLIVFVKTAGANEKADRLLDMLATDKWDVEQSDQCRNRLVLYANAERRRISFPMAGLRMNYSDVRRQLIAWCLAAVISLLKAVFGNAAR